MNKEINHWTSGGTGITNFNVKEKPLYEAAIKEFGHTSLFIGESMPPANGDGTVLALRYTGTTKDLSDFWRVFNKLKMINNKLYRLVD